MRIKSSPCPWCGIEIHLSPFRSGVCPTCQKPYKPIILLFNKSRTHRSESSPLYYYSISLFLILFVIFTGPKLLVTSGFSLVSILFLGVFITPFAMLKKPVHLTRKITAGTQPPIGRYVHLANYSDPFLFYTPFTAQARVPDTQTFYEDQIIRLHIVDLISQVVMETNPDAPSHLESPGIEFRIPPTDSHPEIWGITNQLTTEIVPMFQAQFIFFKKDFSLSKEDYYIAMIEIDGEEIPFYIISHGHDFLESAHAKLETYEITLCHPTYSPKELALPLPFLLHQKDHTYLGSGTITTQFSTRNQIDSAASTPPMSTSSRSWY